VSFWHQTSLATLAVHHPTPTHPRLQSRSGTHADVLLSLRDGAPRPSVLQPHLDTCQPRQRIPCNAAACTCNGAASLAVSLCLCKNFNVELRPRSFLWLASPLAAATAPAAAAAGGGQNAHGKRPRPQGGSGGSCPVHPTARHSAADCRDIQKLAKRVSGRREQASKDGSPHLVSGLARRKPPTVRPLPGRRSWGTNPPLGS